MSLLADGGSTPIPSVPAPSRRACSSAALSTATTHRPAANGLKALPCGARGQLDQQLFHNPSFHLYLVADSTFLAAALARRRCTRSSPRAAGVTPGIRRACPTVVGRCRSNFSTTSAENPWML